MKKSILFISLIAVVFILEGCITTGLTASSHLTNVGMASNNYRIVATNVSGEASSKGILGVSFGIGAAGAQFSVIPLSHNRSLYKTAMQNLWADFEAKNGSGIGRSLALANLRYDSETLNTFFYTKVKIVVVADVIEFK